MTPKWSADYKVEMIVPERRKLLRLETPRETAAYVDSGSKFSRDERNSAPFPSAIVVFAQNGGR